MISEIIYQSFDIIKKDLLNSLGKNYEIELNNIFNLKILDDNISVRFLINDTEIFSIILKKSELLELPKIIQNNSNIIKEKIIKKNVDRKVLHGDGGDSTVISVIVENVIIDEFNNPISDEFGNRLTWL